VSARVLSTREAGPVIIVTTEQAARLSRARELERAGADLEIAAAGTLASALDCLGRRQVGSLLLEGGATIFRAAWDEGLVDYVTLYLTPHILGERAVRFLDGRSSIVELTVDSAVTRLGPDTMMERYVHRSH
jgi:diaminohydroxyphosphoribosylaminopyrimidine deaminase/5-amino-6-(5-phosphoribosylamino)uracil reductase